MLKRVCIIWQSVFFWGIDYNSGRLGEPLHGRFHMLHLGPFRIHWDT